MVGFTISSILGQLFSDRRDPDGRESHALDIIQLQQIKSDTRTADSMERLQTWLMIPCQLPPQ